MVAGLVNFIYTAVCTCRYTKLDVAACMF